MGDNGAIGEVLALVTPSSVVFIAAASISSIPVVSVRRCATGSSRGASSFGKSGYCQLYSGEDERMESFVVTEAVGRRTTGTGSSSRFRTMGVRELKIPKGVSGQLLAARANSDLTRGKRRLTRASGPRASRYVPPSSSLGI